MPDWDLVTRPHVLAAMEEHDRLGSREFLRRYGFGRARSYVVWHRGQEYASKAVLGVAYLHATGKPATSEEFTEGEQGAAEVLIASASMWWRRRRWERRGGHPGRSRSWPPRRPSRSSKCAHGASRPCR